MVHSFALVQVTSFYGGRILLTGSSTLYAEKKDRFLLYSNLSRGIRAEDDQSLKLIQYLK